MRRMRSAVLSSMLARGCGEAAGLCSLAVYTRRPFAADTAGAETELDIGPNVAVVECAGAGHGSRVRSREG
jgi:hypothetical protein